MCHLRMGFASHDIEEARVTLIIDDNGVTSWANDNWHEHGELEVDRTFVDATCFCKVDWHFDDDPVRAVDDTWRESTR